MKKDYITLIDVGDPDREITALEVFYLKELMKKEPRIVDDAGCDIETGKYVGGGLPDDDWGDPLADDTFPSYPPPTLDSLCGNEMDVNENSAGGGAHAGFVCDEEGHVSAIEGCCPIGHKGETGQRGYEESNIYKLILASLDKALPDAKESFREVVADGIAKKITKHMNGEE